MAVQPVPEGYGTVTPVLIAKGAAGLIDFMREAFDAQERLRMPAPDGRVAHAELSVGDSVIMVSDATEQYPATTAGVHLYLEDVDAVYQKALAAGASTVMEPTDQFYGDRSATVRDAYGNLWSIATHVEDVSEEEMTRRMQALGQP